MRSIMQGGGLAYKPCGVAALILGTAVAAFLVGGCGGNPAPAADQLPVNGHEAVSTPRAQGITTPAIRFVPGTVALFDIRGQTAKSLDMGTSVLLATWIDDGETVLVQDGYAGKFLAMKLDGAIVREIADVRVTTGYEPIPVVYPVAVNDGHSVAVSDWETMSLTLIDIRDGAKTTLREHAMAGGEFSPDGEWLAGWVTPVDSHGIADTAASRGGVFARDGRCGDNAPYACLAWELPWASETGTSLGFASPGAWAPDGKHVLMERRSNCPAPTPGARDSAPCTPDALFEVYSWPSHELVLAIPSGEARWSGSEQLQVRGSGDPGFSPRSGFFVRLDGSRSAAPEMFASCCVSYSPDGRYAILSVNPGEDCSLVDVSSGRTVASASKGPGDTNDTGICQVVSWTDDGSKAIASGVALSEVIPKP